MTPTHTPAREVRIRTAVWSVSEAGSHEVVDSAAEALAAGLDGPTLRQLAACTRAEADYDVPELLPVALGELGFDWHPPGSEAALETAARALAALVLTGELTPGQFAFCVHQRCGHALPLTERLARLDDEYCMGEYSRCTALRLDAEVTAEARRLAARLAPQD